MNSRCLLPKRVPGWFQISNSSADLNQTVLSKMGVALLVYLISFRFRFWKSDIDSEFRNSVNTDTLVVQKGKVLMDTYFNFCHKTFQGHMRFINIIFMNHFHMFNQAILTHLFRAHFALSFYFGRENIHFLTSNFFQSLKLEWIVARPKHTNEVNMDLKLNF